jgi:antitoxin component HigA of HigAB toxin-antitoxin module
MHIKPIRTKADHRAALKEIDGLVSATPGTPESDRLDVLATVLCQCNAPQSKSRVPFVTGAAIAQRMQTVQPCRFTACRCDYKSG